MNRTAQTIVAVVLVLLLLGALPLWPYSGAWGYYPSGGLGFLLIVVLLIALLSNSNGPRAIK